MEIKDKKFNRPLEGSQHWQLGVGIILTFDYNGDPLVYLSAVVVEFPLLTSLPLSPSVSLLVQPYTMQHVSSQLQLETQWLTLQIHCGLILRIQRGGNIYCSISHCTYPAQSDKKLFSSYNLAAVIMTWKPS